MNAPKLPKPDLPIHLQQALLIAASVLRRMKEKQAQKAAEALCRAAPSRQYRRRPVAQG